MLELFRDAYRYRELLWVLALKELKVRYKRSTLGFVWALLHPFLMMTVLTIVFSAVMRIPVENYAIFEGNQQVVIDPGQSLPHLLSLSLRNFPTFSAIAQDQTVKTRETSSRPRIPSAYSFFSCSTTNDFASASSSFGVEGKSSSGMCLTTSLDRNRDSFGKPIIYFPRSRDKQQVSKKLRFWIE